MLTTEVHALLHIQRWARRNSPPPPAATLSDTTAGDPTTPMTPPPAYDACANGEIGDGTVDGGIADDRSPPSTPARLPSQTDPGTPATPALDTVAEEIRALRQTMERQLTVQRAVLQRCADTQRRQDDLETRLTEAMMEIANHTVYSF